MMKQTNVLGLAVVIVVAVVPSIAVAFVVLPPYAAVAAAAARLNYHPNGDLGGGGYPPMTGSGAYHLGGPESSAFPPPMGLEGQQLPDGDDPLAATYDRALDCANNFGMCEIDELLDLSEELDEYMDSCYVEDGPEACENEIGDRQELSEALLVQGEMREHEHRQYEEHFAVVANEQQQQHMVGVGGGGGNGGGQSGRMMSERGGEHYGLHQNSNHNNNNNNDFAWANDADSSSMRRQ